MYHLIRSFIASHGHGLVRHLAHPVQMSWGSSIPAQCRCSAIIRSATLLDKAYPIDSNPACEPWAFKVGTIAHARLSWDAAEASRGISVSMLSLTGSVGRSQVQCAELGHAVIV